MPMSPRGSTLELTTSESAALHLVRAWSLPNPGGIWSNGEQPALILRATPDLQSLTIDGDPSVPGQPSRQRVIASLNGIKAAKVELVPGDRTIVVPVSDEVRATLADGKALTVEFRFPDAISHLGWDSPPTSATSHCFSAR